MNDIEKQLDELVHRLRDKWQHSEEDCYAAANAIEKLRNEIELLKGDSDSHIARIFELREALEIADEVYDEIERLRIENQMFKDAHKIVSGINERQTEEINKLRRENAAFTEIAFDMACVGENLQTEHDDLLIDDAFRRAKEWYKENKE